MKKQKILENKEFNLQKIKLMLLGLIKSAKSLKIDKRG